MRAADYVRLVVLAAIWGASFIFMRLAAPALGPVLTAASRVLIAGAVLIGYLAVRGLDSDLCRLWPQYLVIGVANSAIPFLLFSFAAIHLPASYSVILNAATPIFGALLAAIFLAERLTLVKLAGLAIGAAGVALVSRAGPVVPDAWFGWSVAACLAAALCYAGTGVYLKRCVADAKAVAVAAWSQLFAGLVLLPVVPFAPAPGAITPTVVGNVLALAMLSSAVAYLLYFRLMADVGPTRTLTVTFLMPAFGMLWGALFLGEAITPPVLAGAALVVGGTALALRRGGHSLRATGDSAKT